MLPSVVGENVAKDMEVFAASMPLGCFVEVGVYKGGTAQYLERVAKEQGRKFFAYDTFTGIPYSCSIDGHKVGDFGDTSFEEVRKNLPDTIVVQGIFPESAVPMPEVAFAHIDCDQYQAIKETAQYLELMMVKGGVMWFDDYGCLPSADVAVEELYEGRIEKAPCGKAIVRF